jgi:hypothetical protein
MKVTLNTKEIDINDEKQIALFQLLCSLSTSRAALNWYLGKEAGRVNLPPQEDIIVLALLIAGIGECLHKFDELNKSEVLQKTVNCDDQLEEAWKLLMSDEVKDIKRMNLKFVRDKSAFHFDAEPIKNFFLDTRKEDQSQSLDLWETTTDDSHGYSPLASLIIANTLINITKPNRKSAELSLKVYGALRHIILDEINEKYNLSVSQ